MEGFICDICSQHLQADGQVTVKCERCGKTHHFHPKSVELTLVFSITALIFYFPANIFPFMTMELYGNTVSSNIWEGVVSLYQSGSAFLAVIIFLASILIPLLKLIILFYLSATARSNRHKKFKTKLYHIIEAIGRWSMLDIFLLAILVAMVKLGHWTEVKPEIGAGLFVLVVFFTLLASANFDPKIIWEDFDGKNETKS